MKKTAAILMGLCLCITLPAAADAAQESIAPGSQSSTIDTTVPDAHMVFIQTEHARVLFQDEEGEDEDEEQATIYAVERFSRPEFLIRAEQGWKIHTVFLNDVDVTEQLHANILTLPEVCEDQRIVVKTEESKEVSDEGKEYKKDKKDPEEGNRLSDNKKTETSVKNTGTSGKTTDTTGQKPENNTGKINETTAAKTADRQMHIAYSMAAVIAALIMAQLIGVKVRKK